MAQLAHNLTQVGPIVHNCSRVKRVRCVRQRPKGRPAINADLPDLPLLKAPFDARQLVLVPPFALHRCRHQRVGHEDGFVRRPRLHEFRHVPARVVLLRWDFRVPNELLLDVLALQRWGGTTRPPYSAIDASALGGLMFGYSAMTPSRTHSLSLVTFTTIMSGAPG